MFPLILLVISRSFVMHLSLSTRSWEVCGSRWLERFGVIGTWSFLKVVWWIIHKSLAQLKA